MTTKLYYGTSGQPAVKTNADTAERFMVEFSDAIMNLIEGHPFMPRDHTALALTHWMVFAFEIACKLRGYKSKAEDYRVTWAGSCFPDEDEVVVTDEDEVVVTDEDSGKTKANEAQQPQEQ